MIPNIRRSPTTVTLPHIPKRPVALKENPILGGMGLRNGGYGRHTRSQYSKLYNDLQPFFR
jgi:hypothetical protein